MRGTKKIMSGYGVRRKFKFSGGGGGGPPRLIFGNFTIIIRKLKKFRTIPTNPSFRSAPVVTTYGG